MGGGRLFLHSLQYWPTLFIPFRAEITHSCIDLPSEPLQTTSDLNGDVWGLDNIVERVGGARPRPGSRNDPRPRWAPLQSARRCWRSAAESTDQEKSATAANRAKKTRT